MQRSIASRVLRAPGGKVVRIVLGSPYQDPKDPNGDWSCPFEVTGLDEELRGEGHGVDSLQAVIEALRGIRLTLGSRSRDLCWLSDTEGDVGLPMIVGYDEPGYTALLESIIEAENLRRRLFGKG